MTSSCYRALSGHSPFGIPAHLQRPIRYTDASFLPRTETLNFSLSSDGPSCNVKCGACGCKWGIQLQHSLGMSFQFDSVLEGSSDAQCWVGKNLNKQMLQFNQGDWCKFTWEFSNERVNDGTISQCKNLLRLWNWTSAIIFTFMTCYRHPHLQ